MSGSFAVWWNKAARTQTPVRSDASSAINTLILTHRYTTTLIIFLIKSYNTVDVTDMCRALRPLILTVRNHSRSSLIFTN